MNVRVGGAYRQAEPGRESRCQVLSHRGPGGIAGAVDGEHHSRRPAAPARPAGPTGPFTIPAPPVALGPRAERRPVHFRAAAPRPRR